MQMLRKPQFSETDEFSPCKKTHPSALENTELMKKTNASDLLFSKMGGGGGGSIYKSHSQRETASSYFCFKRKYYFYSPQPCSRSNISS